MIAEAAELCSKLLDMLICISVARMGQIARVVHMRKATRKFEPALQHHVEQSLDRTEFGLAGRPDPDPSRDLGLEDGPRKGIAVWRGFAEDVCQ